jgi:membrane associated rhomboid family serine protease
MKFTAVKVLVAANVLVFLLQGLANDWMEMVFALWPLQPIEGHVYFHPWQLITYAFLHDTGNISHIAFNMLGL